MHYRLFINFRIKPLDWRIKKGAKQQTYIKNVTNQVKFGNQKASKVRNQIKTV